MLQRFMFSFAILWSRTLTWHAGRDELWLAWESLGLGGFQARNQWIHTHLCLHYMETASGKDSSFKDTAGNVQINWDRQMPSLLPSLAGLSDFAIVWNRRRKARKTHAEQNGDFRARQGTQTERVPLMELSAALLKGLARAKRPGSSREGSGDFSPSISFSVSKPEGNDKKRGHGKVARERTWQWREVFVY